MNIEKIVEILNNNKLFVGIGLAVLFVMIIAYVWYARKRRYQRLFDALEIKYNELMSIPVLFKINKANGLAKLNPAVMEEVTRCKGVFEDLNKRQDEISSIMAEAEDAIAYNKLKHAQSSLEDLEGLISDSLVITNELNDSLEVLLEQETQQRFEITELKERFRSLKYKMQAMSSTLAESYGALESITKDIEHNFSVFEEWMFASDFEKAKETAALNVELVAQLEDLLKQVPELYELSKGIVPEMLDALSKQYQDVISNDVYIDHIEVPKNIALLSEVLKEDIIRIGQIDVVGASQSLEQSVKRLDHLAVALEKERKSHFELSELMAQTFDKLDGLLQGMDYLLNTSEKDELRFNFVNHHQNVLDFDQKIRQFDKLRFKLERMIEEEKIPASTVLISLNELKQDIDMLEKQFTEVKTKVDQAKSDEVRANNQLLKLHLIINDVQVRIKKRSVDSISDAYEKDLDQALKYTTQIKKLLEDEVIDVTTLNATVAEAIDYIYKLHNNVNNLVGVVDMCENALVYANKFRAYVPDIDAELTRSELLFNNGEYTQALTMIINSIDRYRPNVNYEEMITDNAKSAR